MRKDYSEPMAIISAYQRSFMPLRRQNLWNIGGLKEESMLEHVDADDLGKHLNSVG